MPTFTTKSNLALSNSFTVIQTENNVELDVTVEIQDEKEYGHFEFYDTKTGGENWYAEGGLWFDGKELSDYDGVFELPDFIIESLNQQGYNTENI